MGCLGSNEREKILWFSATLSFTLEACYALRVLLKSEYRCVAAFPSALVFLRMHCKGKIDDSFPRKLEKA